MNRYPVWKYVVIVIALLLGTVYTLPNFFGEAPAVQVSSGKATIKVDTSTLQKVEEALKASNIKYVIHICFSASNMQFIARKFPYGLIVADNDNSHVGEITARKTGKPYWISSTIGEDFNDFHKRVGTFQASQALKKKLIEIGSLVI